MLYSQSFVMASCFLNRQIFSLVVVLHIAWGKEEEYSRCSRINNQQGRKSAF